MARFTLAALLVLVVAHCYGAQQVQMPDTAELNQADDDLQSQIKDLQKNVTDIWTYIYELRSAVSNHLNHLREHQVSLEESMHKMEHLHESELQSSGDHHHSGEHHSHSGEQHSHGGDHSHSGEHPSHSGGDHSHDGDHSHSGDHSHDSDHSHGGGDHSHSGEHHSHSGEHHSHSGEHHSHGTDYGHSSHSHSHSSHEDGSHSHGDDHHQHSHGDSHETEDIQQKTQQTAGPPPRVSEPVVVATDRRQHSHSHHHQHHHGSHSSPSSENVAGMNLMSENNFRQHRHHHHRHDDENKNRSRTVELPKFSDYGLYDLAMCDVTPNRAIPDDQQQNVIGSVTLWQKKSGGPLNMHVQLQGFAVGDHHGHHQSVQQEENNDTPQVGHKHGFHIHTSGDLSNGCQSTGPHFNPKGTNHGGPNSLTRHVGDLGMISCDDHGNTNILFSDDIASLRGPYSIIGRSIVIHTLEDDLGQGGNEESLKTGNAGTRIACCVIRQVDKIPIRQHTVMKYAAQHKNR